MGSISHDRASLAAARLLRSPDDATGGRLIHSDLRTEVTKTTPEQNKVLVLQAFETLFNKHDYAGAQPLWSDPYIQCSAHIAPGRVGLFDLVRSRPQTLPKTGRLVAAVECAPITSIYGEW
jgi:hypothetical protein